MAHGKLPIRKNFRNITGMRFGRLLVVSFCEMRNHKAYWNCDCDCGTQCQMHSASLLSSNSTSCGCLKREATIARNLKHGFAARDNRPPEYGIWKGLVRRCTSKTDKRYESYGGRGIKVCTEWLDFATFYRDMGSRPSPQHSIERKDNDGDYSPTNCIWGTDAEQRRNQRRNHFITFNGETLCLADWASKLGFPPKLIGDRLSYGWSEEKALTTPVNQNRSFAAKASAERRKNKHAGCHDLPVK